MENNKDMYEITHELGSASRVYEEVILDIALKAQELDIEVLLFTSHPSLYKIVESFAITKGKIKEALIESDGLKITMITDGDEVTFYNCDMGIHAIEASLMYTEDVETSKVFNLYPVT